MSWLEDVVGKVGWLVGWLVGGSVGRSVGWVVGWLCLTPFAGFLWSQDILVPETNSKFAPEHG